MALEPLFTEIVATFFVSVFLIHRYGDWAKHNSLVTTSVFVAWFFSFMVIFILPLDISTVSLNLFPVHFFSFPLSIQTAYLQCQERANLTHQPVVDGVTRDAADQTENTTSSVLEFANTTTIATIISIDTCKKPWTFVSGTTLPKLWRIAYWTTQLLTWFIFPILQKFCSAGDFTVMKRLKSSLRENLIFYGAGCFGFLFFFLYLAITKSLTFESVRAICITASNVWGLTLLTILLGYGLVQVPRSIYESSNLNYQLNYLYFKVAKLSAEKCEAEEKLDDTLELVEHTYEAIRQSHFHLKECMDIVLSKCPVEWSEKLLARYEKVQQVSFISSSASYTEADLVSLHRNILRTSQEFHRTQLQWKFLLNEVFDLEDVQNNLLNSSRIFSRVCEEKRAKSGILSRLWRVIYSPYVEWHWKCQLRTPILKCIGCILAIVSFLVIWSEMFFSIRYTNLSVFSLLHNTFREHESYFLLELVSILTIAYLCVCTYYTVFKVRIFNYYYLASHHQTDEYSLIFCAMLLCRLTPPLCLNFLSLMHLDSNLLATIGDRETAFSAIMGHMGVIESIASSFRVYLPIVMCFFCIATFLDIDSRFLHFMGIEQFVVDDEATADLIKDGSQLVKRESNKRFKHRKQRWIEVQAYVKNDLRSGSKIEFTESNRTDSQGIERPPEASDTAPSLVIRDLMTDSPAPEPRQPAQSQLRSNIFDDL